MKPTEAAIWPTNSQRETPLASLSRHWVTIWRVRVASRMAEAVQPTMSGFMRAGRVRGGAIFRGRPSVPGEAGAGHAALTRAVFSSPLPPPVRNTPMTEPRELEEKFWKALESDRTVMLGLDGQEDGHARPMTGLAEDRRSPIWFFTSSDNVLVRQLGEGS